MQTTTQEVEVEAGVATEVDVAEAEQHVQELHKIFDPVALAAEIDALSNEKEAEYYAQREELQKRIKELSAIGNQEEIDVLQADLDNVEKEIAKRTGRVGSLVATIGAELDMFADLSNILMQDAPEDIAKRENAYNALADAEQALVELKARIQRAKDEKPALEKDISDAEEALETARASWKFWNKKTQIRLAKNALAEAKRKKKEISAIIEVGPDTIQDMKIAIEDAKDNILSVEEEIKVDKDARLRQLDLDKLYAKITDAEQKLSKLTEEAIKATEKGISNTEGVLSKDREFALSSAKELEEVQGDITDAEYEFSQAKEALEEETPNTERWHEMRNKVADLATKLDELDNRRKIITDNISTAEVNIHETEATLRTLKTDLLMAKRNYNDFVLSVDKARQMGENLVIIFKNQPLKVSGSSIIKGRNAMTLAVLDAANSTTRATAKELADRASSRLELLEAMRVKEGIASAAIAEEVARYNEAAQKYSEEYAEFGEESLSTDSSSDRAFDQEEVEKVEREKPKLYT